MWIPSTPHYCLDYVECRVLDVLTKDEGVASLLITDIYGKQLNDCMESDRRRHVTTYSDSELWGAKLFVLKFHKASLKSVTQDLFQEKGQFRIKYNSQRKNSGS